MQNYRQTEERNLCIVVLYARTLYGVIDGLVKEKYDRTLCPMYNAIYFFRLIVINNIVISVRQSFRVIQERQLG